MRTNLTLRNSGWQYLWQHNLKSLNFTGFLAPLYSNGTRESAADYDPLGCGDCEGGSVAYEALPWGLYFFNAEASNADLSRVLLDGAF